MNLDQSLALLKKASSIDDTILNRISDPTLARESTEWEQLLSALKDDSGANVSDSLTDNNYLRGAADYIAELTDVDGVSPSPMHSMSALICHDHGRKIMKRVVRRVLYDYQRVGAAQD